MGETCEVPREHLDGVEEPDGGSILTITGLQGGNVGSCLSTFCFPGVCSPPSPDLFPHSGDPAFPQCSVCISVETEDMVREGSQLVRAFTGLAAWMRRWTSFQRLFSRRRQLMLMGHLSATPRAPSPVHLRSSHHPQFTEGIDLDFQ